MRLWRGPDGWTHAYDEAGITLCWRLTPRWRLPLRGFPSCLTCRTRLAGIAAQKYPPRI